MRTRAYERKFVMPVKRLPSKPSLDHLKHQAKDLLRACKRGDRAGLQRFREFHPRFRDVSDSEIATATLKLSDGLLAIARERGFASWTRLKSHIEGPVPRAALDRPHHERIEDPVFRRAVDLLDAGDVDGLRLLLRQRPKLVQ